jgi:hypothetical protein
LFIESAVEQTGKKNEQIKGASYNTPLKIWKSLTLVGKHEIFFSLFTTFFKLKNSAKIEL